MIIKYLKILLSVFLCYHLVVILLAPNATGYLSRKLSNYYGDYINLVGLNYNWNFFSPNPPKAIFFNYDVVFENEAGDEVKPIESYIFPDYSKLSSFDTAKSRFSTTNIFLSLRPQTIEQIFIPWVCKKFPGASHVYMATEIFENLTLENSLLNINEKLEDLYRSHKTESVKYACSQKVD